MEKHILSFLESQSFEFLDNGLNFFGTYLDYTVNLSFNGNNSTLKLEVYDSENETVRVLRDSFIDDVFGLLEDRLREHYAEIKAMEDQRSHEEYLWNHR